ncbi:hypothetical protein RR48_06029 [Papilio machaon]|uniref:Uncharacterized protein n=1 Tax=Papilio machaon TaxID=76193 RepID=A0A194RF48_PAPMA|nr:hypothetical protein RR48_06029 [Papilio machaon]
MSSEKGNVEPVDADSILRQLGQAGRFHLQVYVMVALAAFQVGLLHTTYIFLAADVPYRSVRKVTRVDKKSLFQLPTEPDNFVAVFRLCHWRAMCEKPQVAMDTDRLMHELGQFRKFHLLNYWLLALPVFAAAHYSINFVFLAADVPYRCVVPECESNNSSDYSPAWLTSALPVTGREQRCYSRAPLDDQLPCHDTAFSEELRSCDHWLGDE